MKTIPEHKKFDVAREEDWYLGFTGVASTRDGLVCAYVKADQHCRTTSDIMVARSDDGGRTWKDHRSISHLDCKKDGAIWISPEINALRDGRIVIICDRGERRPDQDHLSLYHWQRRGMSNHLFWSEDGGRTWTGPQKIDDLGGEPERVSELSDGTLIFTRTEAADRQDGRTVPMELHGTLPSHGYYRNAAVVSENGGKTWHRRGFVSDDPLYSDCEVGIAEVSPGCLVGVTRCGDMGSIFGQPSRLVFSSDYGKTWSKPVLAPFHGHRPIPGMLRSGRILVTFRHFFATPGSCAFVFDPGETFTYQPSSVIRDESRCAISNGVMTVRTDEGHETAVDFALYPAEDAGATILMEAELSVADADINGCCVSAGCWVRFQPKRICLADRAEDGFNMDATCWRKYRILREKGRITIFVDGEMKLQRPLSGIETRLVHFGNRSAKPGSLNYTRNRSRSQWRSLYAEVKNREDHPIRWAWRADEGYPDQFRRDRLVLLDRCGKLSWAHSGYSGWTQTKNGEIVIVDYTCGSPAKKNPFIRSYVITDEDIT